MVLSRFSHRMIRLAAALLVFAAAPVVAQDGKDIVGVDGGLEAESGTDPENTPKPLPQRGSLSRSLTSGTSGTAVDLPWGDVTGRTDTPIRGSVSRIGARDWVMKVFNNDTKDTFSVDVQVLQYGTGQRTLKSDSYSYTLKPRQAQERKFIASANAVDCELKMLGWRNLTKKAEKPGEVKPESPPPAAPAATPARVITPAPVAVVPRYNPTPVMPRYNPTVRPLR